MSRWPEEDKRLESPRVPGPMSATAKQRGIYSEYLGKSTPSARKEATHGPAKPSALASAAGGSAAAAHTAVITPVLAPVPPAHLYSATATYRKPKAVSTPIVDPKAEQAAAAAAAAARRSSLRGPFDDDAANGGDGSRAQSRSGSKRASLAGSVTIAGAGTGSAKPQTPGLSTTAAATATAGATASADAVAAGAAGAEPPKLEPKVLVSHVQRPGQPPRRIEIERKKRLYATQHIEELLRAEGVDYSLHGVEVDHELGKNSYLALEIFDDTEYESRTPLEWIALGTDAAGHVQVRGKGLRFERKNGPGRWMDCVMTGYDKKEDKFTVKWSDTGATAKLFRIHLLFETENPFLFARRVGIAHRLRREFEANIRYSLYIDSMPTDEIQPLDTEQVNRVLVLALNTRKLKQNALDTTSLLNEVNIDYARTMNKIIFDVNLRDPSQQNLRALMRMQQPAAAPSTHLAVLPQDKQQQQQQQAVAAAQAQAAADLPLPSESVTVKKPVPYLGVVPVPFHDFPKHFSDFCFHSFYTKSQAIMALGRVRLECRALANWSIFNTDITKSVTLSYFEQHQINSVTQCHQFLKEKWIGQLKAAIRQSLNAVGKGWFNLAEKSREVYLFSKLKRLMTMVNFMMQDALRDLVQDNVRKYVAFVQHATAYKVRVTSTHQVLVTRTDQPEEKPADAKDAKDAKDDVKGVAAGGGAAAAARLGEAATQAAASAAAAAKARAAGVMRPSQDFALFSVDLILKDGVVQYSTPPAAFVDTPLALFDRALHTLHDIPQLETKVMEQLFKTGNDAKLASVRKQEEWVEDLYDTMQDDLDRAVAPLHTYLATYDKYREFIAVDVDRYVAEYAAKEHSIEEIRREIQSHLRARTQTEAEIPKTLWLGLVMVTCEDVRFKLANKRVEIVQKLLEHVAELAKRACDRIQDEFKRIDADLKKVPDDIGQLVAMRKYIHGVQLSVGAQRKPIVVAMQHFELLEEFAYRASKEQFRLKWNTFHWPKMLADHMAAKENELNSIRTEFLIGMQAAQEAFDKDITLVSEQVAEFGKRYLNETDKIKKMADKVTKLHAKIKDLQQKATKFQNEEMQFAAESVDLKAHEGYKMLAALERSFEPYHKMWTTADAWVANQHSWFKDPFRNINGDDLGRLVSTYTRDLAKVLKKQQLKDNKGFMEVAVQTKKELDDFKQFIPLIQALRAPGMKDRHWDELSKQLGFDFRPSDGQMTLTRIVQDLNMQQHIDVIMRISGEAAKEYQIESQLTRMSDAWVGVKFDVRPHREPGTYVLHGKRVEEIIQVLDEHIVATHAMQFADRSAKKFFDDKIHRWANKLRLVNAVLEEWMRVQTLWIALEPIFASADIVKQLPKEAKDFARVHKVWKHTMNNVHQTPDVLSFCDKAELYQKFVENNRALMEVQRALNKYLEKKRNAFARFYFLSDNELLKILSKATDPTAVQEFMRRLFEGIEYLRFDAGSLLISAMFNKELESGEEEMMAFDVAVDPKHKYVEHWLGEVERAMKRAVKQMLEQALQQKKTMPRGEWVTYWPGQCVLAGSQIEWTVQVEKHLRKYGHKGVRNYLSKVVANLSSLVAMVRGHLTPKQRIVLGALIVLDVHARDVTAKLVAEGVSKPSDFTWLCQLRYYQDESLYAQMVQSRFPYGYEYLGNTGRLVITPLTDRCYMTLMTALQLHLGGSPQGPAGTGKTETVKDLAKALAKQCQVFNCQQKMDIDSLSNFFKGLAASGAWTCFDEFNTLELEVLSVVAQQIACIWEAIRAGVDRFTFQESEAPISLDPYCSVFITMNPGYAGRNVLPDNLKALFRPVAMMVPDYGLIAEIMLYSFGFDYAKPLSVKMVHTFKLASEQLSNQKHYDYGMRAVKTSITRAGILKRGIVLPADRKGVMKKPEEEAVVLRALHDVNMPKFLKDDVPLFEGIIGDLFPGIDKPEPDYGQLTNALALACRDNTEVYTNAPRPLQPTPVFLHKCLQLYETTVVRHGVMLVGPTGGGKTSVLNVLRRAVTRLAPLRTGFEQTRVYTLNPKAVTLDQLLGENDTKTNFFTPGILAEIVARCIDDHSPTKHWVVFDGPVDADWIESINSVLDDNKKLCLTSREIMTLTPQMTMIFEVEDLLEASPATVSRCGMVYIEPHALGLAPQIRSWLDTLATTFGVEVQRALQLHFDTLLEPAIGFVRRNCAEPVPTVDNALCASLIRILDALLSQYVPTSESAAPTDVKRMEAELVTLKLHIEPVFVFALIWSVGGAIDKVGRTKFDRYLRHALAEHNCKEAPPAKGLVYDYVYDVATARWVGWMSPGYAGAPPQQYVVEPGATFSELIIPTIDSVRYTRLLDLLVRQHQQVLFTGSTGTGKSVNVRQYVQRLPDPYHAVNLIFSAATTAQQTDEFMFSKLDRKTQQVYVPLLGKRYVIVVDDMNMPRRHRFGAQPVIELVRQWMDHRGWHFKKLANSFRYVEGVSWIGAMGPPGGGRNPVTARLLRHFNQIAHTDLATESVYLIFSTIMHTLLTPFPAAVQALTHSTVQATIDVYHTLTATLKPTPAKSHYTFNLRDLSAVFQGILSAYYRSVDSVPVFLRLWIHENRRVFRDRLVDDVDRARLDALLASMLRTHFNVKQDDIAPANHTLLFGDYMGGMQVDQHHYEEVTNVAAAARVMEESLAEYNSENDAKVNLVMFLDAIEHVSRIARVIRQPGGNALLLGVGGSGRQSLTKLAVYMAGYTLFQIEITKSFDVALWREAMKKLLLSIGTSGNDEQPTVFLFSDTQITNETFLEDINNILNSGEIPNLMNEKADEDQIVGALKGVCQSKRIAPTPLNCMQQFSHRIKQNLHIVLCMSPMGNAFRTRLRMFPSLVNCCTIDWFTDWPAEALKSVANHALVEPEYKLDALIAPLVRQFEFMHSTVVAQSKDYAREMRRYNYVTPTSYLEVLQVFKGLLIEKRTDVNKSIDNLENGLETLRKAEIQVAELQAKLKIDAPKLTVKQAEVKTMMERIVLDKQDASKAQEEVERQTAAMLTKETEAKELSDKAQKELDQVLPFLEQALEGVKLLNRDDIEIVRAFKHPPAGVVTVMEVACVMLQFKYKIVKVYKKQDGAAAAGRRQVDWWATAQTNLLSKAKPFLEALKSYDAKNIHPKVLEQLAKYVRWETFQVEAVATASQACKAICQWAHAMYHYHQTDLIVQPKREEQALRMAEHTKISGQLKETKDRLETIQRNIQKLSDEHSHGQRQAAELQRAVEKCQLMLDRAHKLIGGLGGEKERWRDDVKSLVAQQKNIVGDVVISAGFIAYLGAFSAPYRAALVDAWRTRLKTEAIPHTDGCNIRTTLSTPGQLRAWQVIGLPSDSMSTENGIIMWKARRWPLLIDPQGQGLNFIKNWANTLAQQKEKEMEASAAAAASKDEKGGGAAAAAAAAAAASGYAMDVIKLTDKNYSQTLETALQYGKWVLIENVGEHVDPYIEQLLMQEVTGRVPSLKIKVGDKQLPFNDNFHLYMCTKHPNPHYTPELQVKVTLLNFTISPQGLEDQMLGDVVDSEAKPLQTKKSDLVILSARQKKQLQQLEEQILRTLHDNASGDILEDDDVVNALTASKTAAREVNERVAETETVEKEIDEKRAQYLPVAQRASLLYFCIADLCMIDPMYQYSLQWFEELFKKTLKNCVATPGTNANDLAARCKTLNFYFTRALWENTCRSLFEQHKLLFTFLMVIRIMQGAGAIRPDEWRCLVTGPPPTRDLPNPQPEWLAKPNWQNVLALADLETFRQLELDFVGGPPASVAWRRFCESPEPQNEKVPGVWDTKLSDFQKLLVLKALRPDKMGLAMRAFIEKNLTKDFTDFPQLDIALSYKESSAVTPLIFILSKGADPYQRLMDFAHEMSMHDNFEPCSLGQKQGDNARRAIEKAMKTGGWVLLQNCHLATSWLPELEKIVEDVRPDKVDEDFRLWLTSLPTPKFPVSILQTGVKMTNEPPKGLKMNLFRSYKQFDESYFTATKKPKEFKKLLYSLAFFHAVVLDRRKFGPLGWNIRYRFTERDLDVTIQQLIKFIDLYADDPAPALTATAAAQAGPAGSAAAAAGSGGAAAPMATAQAVAAAVGRRGSGGAGVGASAQTFPNGLSSAGIPFKIIHFLTYDINYGGRVTDDIDRRTIRTILDDFMQPAVLSDDYRFSASDKYSSLPAGNREHYLKAIMAMDAVPTPDVFGMHDNADITSAEADTAKMFGTILNLLPRRSAGSDLSRDKQIGDIATAMLARVPPEWEVEAVAKKFPTLHSESMNTVIVQETLRYNNLLGTMRRSLDDLLRALAGDVVMTEPLEAMSDSLFTNQIPKLWSAEAYPSLKSLSDWFADLLARVAFIGGWIRDGPPPVFWISGFFFPQAFLTGARQNFARSQKKAIDAIGFDFKVLKASAGGAPATGSGGSAGSAGSGGSRASASAADFKELKRPEFGVYVHGLYLEGARWDAARHTLADSRPKELYTAMPVIHFVPVADRRPPATGVYHCPLYKTLRRKGTLLTTGHSTNFIMSVELPTDVDERKWIKAGVALFTALKADL